ncbi:hypothetical protein EDB84DRAFT_1447344 [Lactarius hengduanensis]|nr:hypothetical protein EDB84DRAFT_1447344 [Lactarius hengduanensis]
MSFLKYLKTHAHVQYDWTPQSSPQLITTSLAIRRDLCTYVANGDISHLCLNGLYSFDYFVPTERLYRRLLNAGPPCLSVVQYGGSLALDPPTPEEEDNIMAALKQSDRVNSINLTVTRSLLAKLSSITTSFSELEDLVLLSRDGVPLTLPSAFRWYGSDGMDLTVTSGIYRDRYPLAGLRRLHSTGIAIPGALLFQSSKNLVDLQLHEIFDSWQFSPEILATALFGMTQLQSLSLQFLSTAEYMFLQPGRPQPPDPRGWGPAPIVLPVLTRLNFRGISQYLERLVARIGAPRLGDIEFAFFNENIGFPKLLEFVDRIGMHNLKSPRRAHIVSSVSAIFISLMQPGTSACLKLQLFCEPSSEQLSFMTQVCIHLPASFFNVEDLRITTTRPSGREDGDYSGWRDILDLFTGVTWFHLDCDLSTNNVRDLQLSERRYEVMLPSLHMLYTPQPGQRHALGVAVVPFMISRRLSGYGAVEYERLCYINELRETVPLSQQVTIEMLSDDILLNIYRYYLDAAPRTWPTLTYVCQRWRQIVHTSPLGLNLRLYCCWPALPIVVQYGGFPDLDPPSLEDDDNIMAALKQSGRVNSISLTVTRSLLGKLSAIIEPFSELEELVLLSRDDMQLTLPSTFLWGPRLRTLHSTRIAFHSESLPQLLSHSHDLVDIQLHEIPSAGYFSPEAFANALSGMTHLRTLSLHFLSLPPRRNYLSLPPLSGERVVLPALMFLKYRGTSKYLDSLVARIDAPGLGDIDITFFSQPTIDASQLGRFIQRTEMQTSHNQAEVQTSGRAISVSFTSSSTLAGTSTRLQLHISCKQLDWQLSSMAQVCDQFSPFLFRVNNIRVNMTQPSSELDDADGEQWLELIRTFGGAADLPVADELTTAILCALGLVDEGHATVLPSLRHIHIENPMAMNETSWDGLLSFITLRSRTGHPVQVNVPFSQCHICHASFRRQEGLDRHLVDEHAFRRMCLYCDDLESLSLDGTVLCARRYCTLHHGDDATLPISTDDEIDEIPA